ncbi:hypothetical protein ACH5RR_028859 [Cinchona calisaya]|uniref:H/ACA ribonucleoprotein complex non-core subunit NAF1 n=1 Tax=Cinchona calisaya TaxID=153742 RepID=A0ABD2YQ07_9GENT
MVGSLPNSNSKEVEKEDLFNPSLSVVGIEDFSLSFADSFLDFEYIKDWIDENPQSCKGMEKDLGGNPIGFSLENNAFEVFDEIPELGSAGIGEKIEVGKGLVGEEGGKLGSLGREKVELVGGEKGSEMGCQMFSDKIKVEEGIQGDEGVKMGGLRCLIEEEMGKVSLDGESNGLVSVRGEKVVGGDVRSVEAFNVVDSGTESGVVVGIETEDTNGEKSGNNGSDRDESDSDSDSESGDDSDTDSDSESDSESESSSSSSSSSSSDDDGEEEGKKAKGGNGGKGRKREDMEMEEGEIVASEPEEMVAWTDDEYDGDDSTDRAATMGPARSKNELTVLPPVPPVNVTLQPHHEIQPVGAVLSVLGAQVIVEGVEKHNPLNEGSVLWITKSMSPLGLVDEIFGPVKNPYYIVRFNSESEVPAGIQPGSSISFVPEFANHVLNDKSLYAKGYDASGANDEELGGEEEFSDDEKEAEYRKMLKNKKRGTSDDKVGNKKKDEKRLGNWSRNSKRGFTLNLHLPAARAELQVDHSRHHVPPIVVPPHQGNQLHSSSLGQGLPYQPGLAFPFAPPASNSGLSAGVPMDQGKESSSTRLGQALAYQPGLSPPFAQLALTCGFGETSGGANAIPFQQPQSMGLPQLPINGMHWVQQINQLYQMPNRLPFQQQINAIPNLPSNLVLSGSQSGFGAEPAMVPWPASLGQNTFSSPPFGMGIPAQQSSLPINVGEQAASSNISETGHNIGSRQHASFSGELDPSQRFSYGGGDGRKPHRRGGGRFRGGRGRQHRG